MLHYVHQQLSNCVCVSRWCTTAFRAFFVVNKIDVSSKREQNSKTQINELKEAKNTLRETAQLIDELWLCHCERPLSHST